MSDELVLPIPNLKLPEFVFQLRNPKLSHLHQNARQKLLEGIEADEMAPYYKSLTSGPDPILPLDTTLLSKMEEKNQAELAKIEQRRLEAEKQEGETEVSDSLRARANYLTRIGDTEEAIKALNTALSKSPGLGSKIDISLTLARIAFFTSSPPLLETSLTQASTLIEKGGDWDRRNRLKVYNGIRAVGVREFKKGAELLSDALSTFTATELIDYEDFVALTVVANTVVLGRVELKAKILKNPEVLTISSTHPSLPLFVKSFHSGQYAQFLLSLSQIEQQYLHTTRLLSPHARWYVREMKIRAYNQLLESYRSLTLENLSRAFGVSVEFVDRDLSKFIAAGRIHATIDKVHGVVETNRPEMKHAQYETIVKQGDLLLNKVQRLSKVLY